MQIEFLYFKGCPNAAETRRNLHAALGEDSKPHEIVDICVEPENNPSALPFLGSPSIYVNGLDLVTGQTPKENRFSCRTFTFGDKRTGVIPVDVIRRRLGEMRDAEGKY